jgi:hypothetical protein
MKIKYSFIILCFISYASFAQIGNLEILNDLEKKQNEAIKEEPTATLSASSRLFADKDDLTSVIMVIPSGSVVKITGSDSTYYSVVFEDSEGFILRRHAVLNQPAPAEKIEPATNEANQAPQEEVTENDRMQYLQNKYGPGLAPKLYAGKIWKGMSSGMVRDSWGTPLKINRDIGGNHVREEWIYNSTWLFIENNILVNWGPSKN